MQQAVELFELLQARKAREAEKSVTVEVQPFERKPRRNEPLFFLTFGTVEGIVGAKHKSGCASRTDIFLGRKGGEVHAFEPHILFG
jgi:hypothetical protein